MVQPIPLRMTCAAAARLIQQRSDDSGNVIVTDHAQERMDERSITLNDVLTIMRRGSVYVMSFRNEQNDWQAEIERRMPGGRDAAVVTVIPAGDRLIIRTVMWRDER